MAVAKEPNLKYLPLVWATNIDACLWSQDRIIVTGETPISEADLHADGDPYLRYLSSVRSKFGQKKTGLSSPHIRFANASGDEELLQFVRDFGPFWTSELKELEPDWSHSFPTNETPVVGAFQEFASLRMEQRIYVAALRLLCELKKGKQRTGSPVIRECISEIRDGVSSWPEQWRAEQKWRLAHNEPPVCWTFDESRFKLIWFCENGSQDRPSPPVREQYPDSESFQIATLKHAFKASRSNPFRAGMNTLCTLVNSFPTEVQVLRERAVETLPWTAVKFGVRHSMYLILRRLLLSECGTRVCRNDRCNRFFESERGGQAFCPNENCSRTYRQRVYWAEKGSRRRKERRKDERRRRG